MPGRVTILAAVALTMMGLASCTARVPVQPAWNNPEVELKWPARPERARIEYRGFLRGASDLGVQRGLRARLGSILFGTAPDTMVKPVAVALNKGDTLVVADSSVPTLHFFDLGRNRYSRLDDEAAAQLISPVDVAIDEAGVTFVSDSRAGRVVVFDADRNFLAAFGSGLVERPTGIALSPDQTQLYVVDTVNCRVSIFDRSGALLGGFGERGTAPGQFNAPTHIVVADDGTVIVSDSLNFRVQSFGPRGEPRLAFGRPGNGSGNFTRPKGVGIDSLGRFYVVDAAFDNVQIFDQTGRLLLAFGGPGGGPGGFNLPAGLLVDSRNRIWVADSFNRRVQVFQLLPEDDR